MASVGDLGASGGGSGPSVGVSEAFDEDLRPSVADLGASGRGLAVEDLAAFVVGSVDAGVG